MDASSISIWELQPDAEIPTHAWTRAYRTLPTSTTPKFPYPHATLYGQPENRPLSVRVWLDVDNGYLWTTPQTARGYDPQPDYVTQNKPNYGYDNIANTVVVRHPLTPARRALAEELLETAAPPVADYPVPPEAATVFRRAGWTPDQVREIHTGWTTTTADDARVWTAHSYEWWWQQRFPRTGPYRTVDAADPRRHADLPPTPLTASDAARLLEAGTRFDVIDAYLHAGIVDVEQILNARPPEVPDDATRIIIGDFIALDPAAARAHLSQHPHTWVKPVISETGPQLLHIDETIFSDTWMIWSDGQIIGRSHLILPPEVEDGEPHRTWAPARFTVAGFAITAPLLYEIMHADNRADLTPDLWMPWQDATGLTSTVTHETAQDVAVGPHATIRSETTITRHTIALPAGEATAWEVADTLADRVHGRDTTRWLYTDLDEATARYTEVTEVQPPVATIEQLAELLGVTGNAITQAIRRDRGLARADRETPRRPGFIHRNGRAELFPTRKFIAWWRSRTGHGPGRGHRSNQ